MTCRLLAAASLALALPSPGAGLPSRPIRIVVPTRGRSADFCRASSPRSSARNGTALLVENRPGAAATSAPSSSTVPSPTATRSGSAPGPLVVNQNLYRKLALDPAQFVPVSIMARSERAPRHRECRRRASRSWSPTQGESGPAQLRVTGSGSTSTSPRSCSSWRRRLKITHIPYKGSAPAMTALLGGEIDLMFDNLGVTLPT